MELRNQNFCQKETKNQVNSGKFCYSSMQRLSFSPPAVLTNYIYKAIIWPVTLYGVELKLLKCEENVECRCSKNSVLKRKLEPIRQLHNDEFHDLYSPPNIIRLIN